MLVTFKSKAAAEVLMYEEHARLILDLLHKDVKRGVLTPEELPKAIARIEAEIVESKRHPASEVVQQDISAHHGAAGDDNEHEPISAVTFHARAYPLLEMMRAAAQEKTNVMWGV